MDPAEYCREIETYLCRKNEGHLVRIVGPAFEQVAGWAAQGVPLAVAYRGIDQYCERYYAKGARRRPVRIEFCEGDILDLFDAWRRAVGVGRSDEASRDPGPPPKETLPAHIDRAITRLTALRAGGRTAVLDARLDAAVRELDGLRTIARHARGDARTALIERLATLDSELLETVGAQLDASGRAALMTEAEAEIAPFAGRMSPDARARAIDAAFDRLLRDHTGLPILNFDA